MAKLKVSVVVPVYNAGQHIDANAPFLVGQSIGSDSYEVIYVDDGSTDDSLARLRRIEAAHDHVRVFTQENSGWPGKPRNVGVQNARGEYVQYVDQDDRLGLEALERMYGLGSANSADIVLGKVAGTMAGPSNVFNRNIPVCSIEDHNLIESLTPHKMFRRAFLLDNDIRFPEGYCRLEDQLYMAQAYTATRRVSVVGDYSCYYWIRRGDGGNNSTSNLFDIDVYFHWLREVVRAVKAGTEPGALRDSLLRRSYRVEIIHQVCEPAVFGDPARVRARMEKVRSIVLEEFPESVRDGLPEVARLRATLLERGDLDSLKALALQTRQVRAVPEVSTPIWRDGTLCADVRVSLVKGDGTPLLLVRDGDRLLLDPALLRDVTGVDEWEVRDPLAHAHAEVVLKDRRRNVGWFPPTEFRPELEEVEGGVRVVIKATMAIDPLTAAGGGPLRRGVHDVWLGASMLGLGRRPRLIGLEALTSRKVKAGTCLVGGPGKVAHPYWTASGQLALDIGATRHPLARRLIRWTSSESVWWRPRKGVALPVRMVMGGRRRRKATVWIGGAQTSGTIVGTGDGTELRFGGRVKLPTGRHPVTIQFGSGRGPKYQVAMATVCAGRVLRLSKMG
ncbi:glycosyltransferase family 2 protein [Nonomuraea soli]|uniref:Glycosyltransferase involved in cell wall biosynthesis n=1 Tax=Nonomuraea soli TaxID=1032476 RepID=A0A7W0CU56_9ACTN|nr:glycosyltransferase [Nonomuraea soli]MBA2897285.1 glycosyltransferase involved in cell wall biosynthesis [Nonomuraea soli]